MSEKTRVATPLKFTMHKHAHEMMQYAKDAALSDQPWLWWEFSAAGKDWRPCSHHPYWGLETEYRRAKRTTITHQVHKSSLDGVLYAGNKRLPQDILLYEQVQMFANEKIMSNTLREIA